MTVPHAARSAGALSARAFDGAESYQVAADHYHLAFENAWARATRVTYGPHEKAPVHEHPPTPTTVYVYVTDGGLSKDQRNQ